MQVSPRKVILASASPRRKELLTAMGVSFDVIPSNYDEQLDDNRSPSEVAIELALGKASEVASQYPDCIVIGADTIVTVAGHQLEKPSDEADAHQMLQALSGTHNDVTTSIVVICKDEQVEMSDSSTTRVFFKPYDQLAVMKYLDSGDYADKAGGYGIQSGAAPLVDYIDGRYDTVIGLPTHLLADMLMQLNIQSVALNLKPPVKQLHAQ